MSKGGALAAGPFWAVSDRRSFQHDFEPSDAVEKTRASKLKRSDDAADFLHARWLMRQLIQQRLPQAGIPGLRSFDDARPELVGSPDLAINWSKSGPFAAAALAEIGVVGIDIERVIARNTGAILSMTASTTEAEAVASAGDEAAQLAAFYRLWTAKEAVLKCRGEGLRGGAKSVEIPGEYILGDTEMQIVHDRVGEVSLVQIDAGAEACCSIAFSAQKPN